MEAAVGYRSRMAALASIQEVLVPDNVLSETWKALRGYGVRGLEGLVLWLGRIEAETATVAFAFVPPQSSISGEDGVGYFVTNETLFQLSRELERTGLRLLAQVHSHPAEAYHSSTDDAFAIVTNEGGWSIVVPNFAVGPAQLDVCAVYRLRAGTWRPLSDADVARVFRKVRS